MSLGPLLLLIAGSAFGLEAERTRLGEWVVVSARMEHSPEAVFTLLRQDAKAMKLGQDVRSVETRPLPNGCTHLSVVNEGFTRPMSYTAERCLVENGWHSKMIDSPDFEDHQIIWTTVAEGDGARVTIRVKVALKVPIPRFVMTPVVGRALEATLEKIDRLLSE